MATLSPFRYLQIARYILQRWLDHPAHSSHPNPSGWSSWKGKGKAPTNRIRNLAFATATLEHNNGHSHNHNHGYASEGHDGKGPIAGPSRSPLPPNPRSPGEPLRPDPDLPPEPSEIYRLMNDERLLIPGAIKPPRETVVLCHGLYGFSTATPIPLFPSLKLHYWASVLEVLRDRMGVDVVVVGVKGTGSIKERAEQMHKYLSDTLPRGTGVNFVAHSMGGLDVRHLISTIKPQNYTPLSLTTIGTPHRGSPFMDWCAANIGVGTATALAASAAGATIGKGLPFSLKSPLLARTEQAMAEAAGGGGGANGGFAGFTAAMSRYLLNIFDSPAYSNLTTGFLRDNFNPQTPDDPSVKYTSVAGRTTKLSVLHPLWFPKMVLDAAAEKGYPIEDSGLKYEGNDGLVSVHSAKWGEFIGAVDDTHHWDLRGEGGLWPNGMGDSSKDKDKEKNKEKEKLKKEEEGGHRREELIMSGGWDWEDGLQEYLGLGDDSDSKSKSKSNSTSADSKDGKDAKGSGKKDDGSWDIAQVGQVLDWVTDMLPDGQSTDAGRKQLAEARAADSRDRRDKEAEAKKKKEKEKKDKFDLARFYGGLMLKLREDGF